MSIRFGLSVVAFAAAFAGCADPQLVSKVDALETRVAALEAGGGGGDTAQREEQAKKLLAEINKAVQDMDFKKASTICDGLTKDLGDTQQVRRGGRVCREVAVVGKEAMELEVEEWFQGKASIAGEPTLLVFWEEWCPHCRREVPKIEELHKQYAGRMKVVGLTKVNRSSTDDSVRKFITEQAVTYPMGKEKGGNLSTHYGVAGVPAAALVKDGKVVWRGHPARLNDEALNKLL